MALRHAREYAAFSSDILEFARKLISIVAKRDGQRRVQYWTALGLLRGVMSSPAAGIEMLNTRLTDLSSSVTDDSEPDPFRAILMQVKIRCGIWTMVSKGTTLRRRWLSE